MTGSTNQNQKTGKGQFCLVVEENDTKYILPLFAANGKELGTLDYLSRVDQMTMRYKNENLLLANYIQRGLLPPLQTQAHEVYVMSYQADVRYKKAKQNKSIWAIPPNKLKVAYDDDELLYLIGLNCRNKIQDDNYFGKKLVAAAFSDITKNPAFLQTVLYPTNYNNPYFSDDVVELIKNITRPINNHLPLSEQTELYREKKLDKKQLLERLTDYKCLRGVYFAYKDFKTRNPNNVELEMEKVNQECFRMIQDFISPPAKKDTRDTSYPDPDRDPYFNPDIFDRPEVPSDNSGNSRYRR